MKPVKYLFAIIIVLICFKSFSQISKKDTSVNVNYGFRIHASRGDDYGNFSTYSMILVFHKGVRVFSDTSKEYEFSEKLYPIANKLNSKTFELLIEVNDRPFKDYLVYLKVKNNRIIEKRKLPTFIGKAADIAGNGNYEYAGFWGYSEVWGDNGQLTDYNPILYYKPTNKGLKLDTLLTIKKNKAIYGKFEGFDDTTDKPVSVKLSKNFEAEINRIEAISNK